MPNSQTFTPYGICVDDIKQDIWLVGAVSSNGAIVKFEEAMDYQVTYAQQFDETTNNAPNEIAFQGCKIDSDSLLVLGYNYATVLFLDTDTNAIEAAGELYIGSPSDDWWRNGGEYYHWASPLTFDYRYGCALLGGWKFLIAPVTFAKICRGSLTVAAATEFDNPRYFSSGAASNYRDWRFLRILSGNTFISIVTASWASNNLHQEYFWRGTYNPNVDTFGSVTSDRLNQIHNSVFQGDAQVVYYDETNRRALACILNKTGTSFGYRIYTLDASLIMTNVKTRSSATSGYTCSGAALEGTVGYVLLKKNQSMVLLTVADISLAVGSLTQTEKLLYDLGDYSNVSPQAAYSNSKFVYAFQNSSQKGSTYNFISTTKNSDTCNNDGTAAALTLSVTGDYSTGTFIANNPYLTMSDVSSVFYIEAMTYTTTNLGAASTPDSFYCDIATQVSTEANQEVKAFETLSFTHSAYNLNYAYCDPLVTKTTADISFSVELAGSLAAPAWFNYNSATRNFNFQPVTEIFADVVYNVVVRATTDSALYDEDKTFTLTVKPKNFAPVLSTSPAASIQCYVDSVCNFPYALTDANSLDTHTITFAEQVLIPAVPGGLPSYTLVARTWLTKDATNLIVSPLFANFGTYVVGLLVVDDNSVNDADGALQVYYTMNLDILYQPNSAPSFDAALVDQTVDNEGGTFTYTLPSASDPQPLDTLTFSFTVLPAAAFISISGQVLTFTVSPAVTGVYTVSARVTDDNTNSGANGVLYYEEDFTLTVEATNYAPTYDGLQLQFSLQEEESLDYYFPAILDDDALDTHTVTLISEDLSDLPDFVYYDDTAIYLYPYSGNQGTYSLLLSLTDDNSSLDSAGVQTTEYIIQIVVSELLLGDCYEGAFEDGEVSIGNQISRTMHSYDKSHACVANEYSYYLSSGDELPDFITYSDRTVFFSPTKEEEIGAYTIESYVSQEGYGEDFVADFTVLVVGQVERIQGELTFKIKEVNQLGMLTLLFSQQLMNLTEDLSVYSNQTTRAFTISLESVVLSQKQEEKVIKNWEVISIYENIMKIQLKFDDHHLVSQLGKDEIKVTVLNNLMLLSVNGTRVSERAQDKKEIPIQVTSKYLEQLKQMSIAMKAIFIAFPCLFAVFVFYLGSPSRLLLKMLAGVQMLVHLQLLEVQLPINAELFFTPLLNLVNFKFFDIDSFFTNSLKSKNENKDGYSDNFIFSLGFLLVILIIFISLLLLISFTKRVFGNKSLKKGIIMKLNDFLFFNFMITMMLITYLPVSMATIKNLAGLNFEDFASKVSGVVSIFVVPIVIFLPIFSFRYLWISELNLNEPEKKSRAGNLYSGMKMKQGLLKLVYNPIFLVRRLLICYIVVALPHFPAAQIQLSCFGSMIVLGYVCLMKPFLNSYEYLMDLINEGSVLCISYIFIAFIDLIGDNKFKLDLGYLVISIVLLNLIGNNLLGAYLALKLRQKVKQKPKVKIQVLDLTSRGLVYPSFKQDSDKTRLHQNSQEFDSDLKPPSQHLLIPAKTRRKKKQKENQSFSHEMLKIRMEESAPERRSDLEMLDQDVSPRKSPNKLLEAQSPQSSNLGVSVTGRKRKSLFYQKKVLKAQDSLSPDNRLAKKVIHSNLSNLFPRMNKDQEELQEKFRNVKMRLAKKFTANKVQENKNVNELISMETE